MAESTGAYEPTVGSLCSGYGGLDMGLALGLGTTLRHAWHVEYDAAPSAILRHRYPEVPNYGDLTTLDHGALEPVDWLTAGYPCQPFSDAGLRLGDADARHLWPYVADAIGRLRPRNVLLENVRGHLRRGFDSVLADLAALGYDASWGVVRASDAGAPHRRERLFVVAQDADGAARGERGVAAPGQAPSGWSRADAGGRGGAPAAHSDCGEGGQRRDADLLGGRSGAPEQARLGGGAAADAQGDGRDEGRTQPAGLVGRPDAAERGSALPADADGTGLEGREPAAGHELLAWGVYEPAVRRWERATGRPAVRATEPRGRGGAERLSPRFVEWLMGLPDGWVTAVPGITANDQLKALGNGVVPQQAALAVRLLVAQHNRTQEAA